MNRPTACFSGSRGLTRTREKHADSVRQSSSSRSSKEDAHQRTREDRCFSSSAQGRPEVEAQGAYAQGARGVLGEEARAQVPEVQALQEVAPSGTQVHQGEADASSSQAPECAQVPSSQPPPVSPARPQEVGSQEPPQEPSPRSSQVAAAFAASRPPSLAPAQPSQVAPQEPSPRSPPRAPLEQAPGAPQASQVAVASPHAPLQQPHADHGRCRSHDQDEPQPSSPASPVASPWSSRSSPCAAPVRS